MLTICKNVQPLVLAVPVVAQADVLAKKGAKITQTHIRETSYHSIKLHLK